MSHLARLADGIAAYGIKHVFGIPGSGPTLTLLDALEARGVQFHLVHFEGSAAIMAGALGQLSGSCGVCLGIKGPGLVNMLPGLALSSLESFPLVSLTESYLPDTPIKMSHKRLDHGQLVSAVVKESRFWTTNGPGFDSITSFAEEECPGPVHVNITANDPEQSFVDTYKKIQSVHRTKPVAELIPGNICKPLIIAGTLAVRKALHRFLNSQNIPVFTTAAAKGAVNETLPHAAGVYTGVGGELVPETELLRETDFIIGIGVRHNEVLQVKPFQCPSILLDPLGDCLATGFCFSSASWCEEDEWGELSQILQKHSWGKKKIAQSGNLLRKHLLGKNFLPAHVFHHIEHFFTGKARLVLDTGLFCTIGEHMWRVRSPELYVSSAQGRYMGVGLVQGIAAALFDDSVPTVVFCGDGGVGMYISEIKLAVAENLPLIVILLSDGGFGTLGQRSLRDGLTQQPLTIDVSSWKNVFEGFGVEAAQAKNENEIVAVLEKWKSGPLFIEIPFDPLAYTEMTNDIR